MKKNKLFIFLIFLFFTNFGMAQSNLVTKGFTSGGGYEQGKISLDFAVGQIFSAPYSSENISGNEGILQVIAFSSVGVIESDLDKINVFPNPTSTSLNVEIPCTTNYNIKLVDVLGRLLLSKDNLKCNQTVNVDYLDSGLYFLIVNQNNKTKTFRINKN